MLDLKIMLKNEPESKEAKIALAKNQKQIRDLNRILSENYPQDFLKNNLYSKLFMLAN